MPAGLSLPYSPVQTARHAVPYSLQHTGTYSRAFPMDPCGLHAARPDGLGSCPYGSAGLGCLSCSHQGANLAKYIKIAKHFKDMDNEENSSTGEFFTLDTKVWQLLEIIRKTDSRGRVHTGENYYGKEIRVFVSDVDLELEKCKHYLLLPSSIFSEVRKSRKKDEIGEPLKVQLNGDIWTTKKDKFVRIFVRK